MVRWYVFGTAITLAEIAAVGEGSDRRSSKSDQSNKHA